MNCRGREEAIALYAGGDLPEAEAAELERHLAGCAACQATLEGERCTMEWLRQAHAESVIAPQYAAVRERVLAELRQNGRPMWWAWGLAGAAAVAIVVALFFPARVRTRVQPVAPPVLAGGGLDAAGNLHPTAGEDRRRYPSHAVRRRLAPNPPPRRVLIASGNQGLPQQSGAIEPTIAAAAQPLVIKLLTDDPNVVIYWIAESKGD